MLPNIKSLPISKDIKSILTILDHPSHTQIYQISLPYLLYIYIFSVILIYSFQEWVYILVISKLRYQISVKLINKMFTLYLIGCSN